MNVDPHSHNEESATPGKWRLFALVVACYVLALGTLNVFDPLGGTSRPELAREFDWFSGFKAATRVFAFVLVSFSLFTMLRDSKWVLIRRYVIPLSVFSVWGIFSTLWSPDPVYTFGHSLEFMLLLMIVPLAAMLSDEMRRASAIIFHLCLIHLLFVLVLIGFSLMNPESASIFRPALETERVLVAAASEASYVMNPAEIAGVASVAILLVVVSGLFWNWRWTRRLVIPVLAVGGGVLFVTQTRAAIVTTALLILAALVFWGRGRLVAAGALALSLLGVTWLLLDPSLRQAEEVGQVVVSYMERGQSPEALKGFGGRISTWSQVVGALPESPIIGHGYSMATPTGKIWLDGELRAYSAHNVFLHVLSGTGFVGLFLFVWGLARLVQPSVSGLWPGPEERFAFLTILFVAYAFLTGLLGDSIVGPIDPTSIAVSVMIGVGTGGVLLSRRPTVAGAPGQ